jgi:hypothetical protein
MIDVLFCCIDINIIDNKVQNKYFTIETIDFVF